MMWCGVMKGDGLSSTIASSRGSERKENKW